MNSIGVASIVDNMREKRLKWLKHVLRREKSEVVRLVKDIFVNGKKRRGRPKKRWRNVMVSGMRKVGGK
jgi:hypothetical protein